MACFSLFLGTDSAYSRLRSAQAGTYDSPLGLSATEEAYRELLDKTSVTHSTLARYISFGFPRVCRSLRFAIRESPRSSFNHTQYTAFSMHGAFPFQNHGRRVGVCCPVPAFLKSPLGCPASPFLWNLWKLYLVP